MKNRYLAYDLIRKRKFVSPDKMVAVEKAAKQKEIVINWWCKQSGKSLTAIKMATDLVINKPDKVVVIVNRNISSRNMMMNLLEKSIDKSLVVRSNTNVIVLNNGSIIKIISSLDNSDNYKILMRYTVDTCHMLIVDEFDYMDEAQMDCIVDAIKSRRPLTIWGKFAKLIGLLPRKNYIFFSSQKDKRNFDFLVNSLGADAAFTYLNYEKLGLDKEKLVKMLGETVFQRDYDSYNFFFLSA
jgi:hypothetical protein